jgi:hypothetical protein
LLPGYVSAKEVAGDYYGFIEQADGSVSLVIADVSGKGVAAGQLMPSIEIALRLDSPRYSGSYELIDNFNGVVCHVSFRRRRNQYPEPLCLSSTSPAGTAAVDMKTELLETAAD